MLKENVVFPDKDGNPMSPRVQIQNRIEVVFVNAPRPDGMREIQERGHREETELEEISVKSRH